jgi:hypothetical protein
MVKTMRKSKIIKRKKGELLRWRVVNDNYPPDTFTTYGETIADGALMALESLGWQVEAEPMGDAEPAEFLGLDDDNDDD